MRAEDMFLGVSHPKKRVFLQAYSRCGNITKDDPDYPELFAEAQEAAADYLEAEAWRRAAEGTEKGIYYKGKKVDIQKEYSDTLLIFLMKGIMPEKYRDRSYTEISGPGGGPVQFESQLKSLLDDD